MNQHIQEELERRIDSQLENMTKEYMETDGLKMYYDEEDDGREELTVCRLFWETNQTHQIEVVTLHEQINQLTTTLTLK
jgi:hypothetical protein